MLKEQAISLLTQVKEIILGSESWLDSTHQPIEEAFGMAIEALEAQQWIPCSERLPEEDGLYLVTTSKGQVQVHVFRHNGNSEEYWMRCNKAWMPLPEPYKENKG